MPYYDKDTMEERKAAFDSAVSGWPGVSEKPMFGSPGYSAFGRMFCFLVTDGIVTTKLPEDVRKDALVGEKCTVFTGHNKKIRNWLVFPYNSSDDLDSALPYVRKSYEAATVETADRD